jgi:hypothetical protein
MITNMQYIQAEPVVQHRKPVPSSKVLETLLKVSDNIVV